MIMYAEDNQINHHTVSAQIVDRNGNVVFERLSNATVNKIKSEYMKMKITKEHALFYASKKSNIFQCDVSIHTLINVQTKLDKKLIDKHNDLQLLKMIYRRCKRNKENLIAELTRVELSGYSKNRTRLFRKCRLKLSRM